MSTDTQPPAERKLAIVCSKGTFDAAYPALILASAARETGAEAMVFFTFWGVDIVTARKIERLPMSPDGLAALRATTPTDAAAAHDMLHRELHRIDVPPIRELLTILSDSGVGLYACELGLQLFRLRREDLVPEVSGVITATEFMDLSLGAQIVYV